MLCHLLEHFIAKYFPAYMDPDDKRNHRSKRLVIVLWVSLIFLYVSFWYLVITPWGWWVAQQSWKGVLNISVAHLIFGMIVFAYWLSQTRDPGLVPINYNPIATEEEMEVAKLEIANMPESKRHIRNLYHKKLRWCSKCEHFKPPRTHHCSCCKRCVLKMDHHCPWLDQCVGFYNQKIFVVFLGWATIGILYSALCYFWKLILVAKEEDQLNAGQWVLLFANLIVLLFFGMQVILLLGNQLFLISQNTTKIELWVKSWALIDSKEFGVPYQYPYDHGIYNNICEVLGPHPILWCIPTLPHSGDGIHYPAIVPNEWKVQQEQV